MSLLDKRTSVDLVKLLIFLVVTALATAVLAVLIGNMTFQSSRTYSAVFSDATGLVKGDDIRIAGVRVGSVKDIQIYDTNQAKVTFSVGTNATVTRSSQAIIKYRNLVGQRYISINQGVGDTSMLPANSTIPITRTQPALDLTSLFNGFQPLFTALTPSDVNQLSYEIIQVFQGEGGTIQDLLSHVASLSNSLADKDQVIGSVIDNLSKVLGNVAQRDQQLSSLIVNLQQFVSGLAQDKDAIFDSLQTINALEASTSDLLSQARPPLAADIRALGQLSGNLADSRQVLENFLKLAPTKIDLITRTAVNGSWFNFFMCSAGGYVVLPGTTPDSANGITVPAGGLSNGEAGCG